VGPVTELASSGGVVVGVGADLASLGGVVVGVRADLASLGGVVVGVGTDLPSLGGVEGVSVGLLGGRIGRSWDKGWPLFAFGVVWLEVGNNGGVMAFDLWAVAVVWRFDVRSGQPGGLSPPSR